MESNVCAGGRMIWREGGARDAHVEEKERAGVAEGAELGLSLKIEGRREAIWGTVGKAGREPSFASPTSPTKSNSRSVNFVSYLSSHFR